MIRLLFDFENELDLGLRVYSRWLSRPRNSIWNASCFMPLRINLNDNLLMKSKEL